MKIYRNLEDFNSLVNMAWSGAIDTLRTIVENDKEDALMDLLEEVFQEPATETKVNDFLWFNDKYIFECLGIDVED